MQEIVLSIIISTYNRSKLLSINLNKMLRCDSQEIEFIVGDNCSSDDTKRILNNISDGRVRTFFNDRNYGFENFWILSENVKGKYFIFVNDRDYINPDDIKCLCKELKEIEKCDFVSHCQKDFAKGYYHWPIIPEIYFESKHPGWLIYNTEFVRKNVDLNRIKEKIEDGKPSLANIFLVFSLLLNANKVAFFPWSVIRMAHNLGRISLTRREYYGKDTYISPEYRIKEFEDWLNEGVRYRDLSRTQDIIKASYVNSLRIIMLEYYISIKFPGFVERYGLYDSKTSAWMSNGIKFSLNVYLMKWSGKFKIDLIFIISMLIKEMKKVIKYIIR